jgi:hypothetical protein
MLRSGPIISSNMAAKSDAMAWRPRGVSNRGDRWRAREAGVGFGLVRRIVKK